MVTDQQYRDVIARMNDLEKRFNALSKVVTEMRMKSDVVIQKPSLSVSELEIKRDVTKYVFNGQKLSKRQVVLEVVKQYVIDVGVSNINSLWEVFPDHIQGSLGVVRRAADAELYDNAASRYYFEDDNVLNIGGDIYVVCKEWTAKNIKKFLEIAETLGYKIEKVYRN